MSFRCASMCSFTSPHPKDFPVPLLELIAERPNICKAVHMPAQSGNSAVLERMRRGYTREAYLALVSEVSWHPTSPHSPHHQTGGGTSTAWGDRQSLTAPLSSIQVERIRSIIPGVALSSDFISGFCGETEEEHRDTISLMEAVRFEQAFMYAYSRRDRTHAAYHMEDNVPDEVRAGPGRALRWPRI